MAERRMFAKAVIDSDFFLDMPMTTQALYFHLAMRADDDGFVNNPKKIKRMIGATDDDLNLLIAKSFLIPFDSGVVVIRHWKIHNYIRKDTYTETSYIEEKQYLEAKSNGEYELRDEPVTNPSQNRDGTLTQVRLGKDRLGKDRLGKEYTAAVPPTSPPVPYQKIADMYNTICKSYPKITSLSEARKKAISARLKTYSIDDIKKLFEKAEVSDFLKGKNNRNWRATFDWLMKDANFAKVLDGNYDSKPQQPEPQPQSSYDTDEWYQMAESYDPEKMFDGGKE